MATAQQRPPAVRRTVPAPLPAPAPMPPSEQPLARLVPPALVLGLAGAAVAAATQQALVAVAIPALIVGAIAATRWPVPAVVGAFVLTGAENVLTAHFPIPVAPLLDYILASLWLGVLGSYFLGRAERRFWLWPALFAAILYLALTAFEILLTDPISLGFRSFRAVGWYMAAFLLVALAPWPPRTHIKIAKGLILVGLAVGLYSIYRWVFGADPGERFAARLSQAGLPKAATERFFGSFLSANQLAAWTATMIPFCLAVALVWSGRWRLVSLAVTGLLALAMLASDVRTGMVAAGIGVAITLSLFFIGPAFRGRRAGGLVIAGAIAALGVGAFTLTVGSDPQKLERFTNILSPGEDEAYTTRLERWEFAIDEMWEEPWGHGLGTTGGIGKRFNEFGTVGPPVLDSAYLKVGLEQGAGVMAFYFVGLLVVLLGFVHRTLLMRDRRRAVFVIGAAGTLAAMMVLFYAGNYSEGPFVAGAWLIIGLGAAQVTLYGDRQGLSSSQRMAP